MMNKYEMELLTKMMRGNKIFEIEVFQSSNSKMIGKEFSIKAFKGTTFISDVPAERVLKVMESKKFIEVNSEVETNEEELNDFAYERSIKKTTTFDVEGQEISIETTYKETILR